MSLSELTDVLTALLFYNFLLSFMLTGCDGCIALSGEEKPLERYKTREEKIIFVVPKQYYRFSGAQRASSKVRLGVIGP